MSIVFYALETAKFVIASGERSNPSKLGTPELVKTQMAAPLVPKTTVSAKPLWIATLRSQL